ncbi:MAG: hypothetical protein LUD72_14035 [Bacteroidales bacterium]|nr:hypothetical protein [Bacteroidales bacterium]
MNEQNGKSLSGFDVFQDQCRYARWKWQKVQIDCSTPRMMTIPYCSHEKNRTRKKKDIYVPVCRKEICPYYQKEDGK